MNLFKHTYSNKLGGHLGKRKTMGKILKHFYWLSIHEDIQRWCRECAECQKCNTSKKARATLMPLPIITALFKRIAMSIVGPLR